MLENILLSLEIILVIAYWKNGYYNGVIQDRRPIIIKNIRFPSLNFDKVKDGFHNDK